VLASVWRATDACGDGCLLSVRLVARSSPCAVLSAPPRLPSSALTWPSPLHGQQQQPANGLFLKALFRCRLLCHRRSFPCRLRPQAWASETRAACSCRSHHRQASRRRRRRRRRKASHRRRRQHCPRRRGAWSHRHHQRLTPLHQRPIRQRLILQRRRLIHRRRLIPNRQQLSFPSRKAGSRRVLLATLVSSWRVSSCATGTSC